MHPYNQTLHKQALQRRKQIRDMLKTMPKRDVLKRLGITRQRLFQIIGKKKNAKRKA